MSLVQRLDSLIADRSLLKHPFYRAWSEGSLTREVLRDYSAQYFSQVDAFPRFVSSVHSRCPEIETRKVLVENLADEEIHGVDHRELWLRFAEGLGASRDAVVTEEPLSETRAMLETFFGLCANDWRDGLCALYAYESQVPGVSQSKIDGLKRFYGVEDARTLSFFTAHLQYDVEHSRQVASLIEKHCSPELAERATVRAADALNLFLDGVAREANIACAA